MPEDRPQKPDEQTRRLIDVLLGSMAVEDIRQLVLEMDSELRKPPHLVLVQ